MAVAPPLCLHDLQHVSLLWRKRGTCPPCADIAFHAHLVTFASCLRAWKRRDSVWQTFACACALFKMSAMKETDKLQAYVRQTFRVHPAFETALGMTASEPASGTVITRSASSDQGSYYPQRSQLSGLTDISLPSSSTARSSHCSVLLTHALSKTFFPCLSLSHTL